MSLTMTMTLNPATAASGEPIEVVLEISNGSADVVDLVEIRPTVQALQRVTDEPGKNKVRIPGNSSVICSYEIRGYQDNQSVSARIYGSDGSTASASASLTIT